MIVLCCFPFHPITPIQMNIFKKRSNTTIKGIGLDIEKFILTVFIFNDFAFLKQRH